MIAGSPQAETDACLGIVATAARSLTVSGQEMDEQAGSSASGASATSGAAVQAALSRTAAQPATIAAR
jgi:hypothetical protein